MQVPRRAPVIMSWRSGRTRLADSSGTEWLALKARTNLTALSCLLSGQTGQPTYLTTWTVSYMC